MPSPPLLLPLLTTTLLLLSLSTTTTTTSVDDHELQRSLDVLRSRGYSLFSNAIVTSELLYDVVSSPSPSSFTFFAPTDFSLFALDMTASSSDYIDTLRCHVIKHRLTAAQLRRLPSGSTFESLMEGRPVRVDIWRSEEVEGGGDVITVNGVVVDFPGLFYSRNVAVHGLSGILNITTGGEMVAPPRGLLPAELSNAVPPLEVAEKNYASTSRRLISGGGGGGGTTAVEWEDVAGVMEMLHADLEKWDGRIFDCLLTDGGHVSTPHGYVFTRQQSHTSMLSCAGLHELLHLQHF